LCTDSVFSVGIRSVFLGITNTNTEGKFGRYFWYQNFGGSPSKNWREPLFPTKGGPRPPFCTFRPPFEEKKEFPRNFSKKEFPQNLKKVFPPKLTVQQYRPKYRKSSKSDTSKIPIPKKLLVTPWYTTLLISLLGVQFLRNFYGATILLSHQCKVMSRSYESFYPGTSNKIWLFLWWLFFTVAQSLPIFPLFCLI
jgi:hypothetical protein